MPEFYRWFLERMGTDMGSMSYDRMDFSAETILAIYENGDATPDGRHLLIGYDENELDDSHLLRPRSPCTRRLHGGPDGTEVVPRNQLRDIPRNDRMGKLHQSASAQAAAVSSGLVSVSDGPVRPHVDAVMKDLGFYRTSCRRVLFARSTNTTTSRYPSRAGPTWREDARLQPGRTGPRYAAADPRELHCKRLCRSRSQRVETSTLVANPVSRQVPRYTTASPAAVLSV